ncbi:amino acid ABC transporter ATP-binding protein [Helicobacter cetorum]|uniref:Phosphate ABC transporter ATP-binding protein n=1 Tax=Helicobacter cetorum (strain ATCC BAA-429 / MIT 00-7128) TaxID=182217 RepID=I0EPT6_HELC0|nr:amino acid ABC transporter ATP-binding protein [Helicobacter cetorum]AFI04955.1 phosphate ABC transporter ATP-binding protein [Helicobacter cetorum MIT 00-7128]
MSVLLETRNLQKTYQNLLVLNGINFTLKKGEVAVILGPSGCGKSTFLRCLNGLEKIDGGEIIFEQQKINTPTTNWSKLRQKIGMVFQNYELFPHLNVLDNILLAPLKVQKRSQSEVTIQAIELLRRVGLEHKQKAYPSELSGGQKQRVAIVRSLCTKPEVMLLDEITASLDPEMIKEVLEVVLELANEGMSMVVVTHEMKFAQKIADKIIFFDSGKIAEENTAKEFFNNPKSQRAQKFLETFHFLGSC